MIVTYKKTEIVVRTGSHGEEVAHAVIDGEQQCFLGGLAEAKRFLKDRALGPLSGPRPAGWGIELESGCSSSYVHESTARSDSDYWRREGRAHRLYRVEFCREPGCDGSERGEITERSRTGRGYSHRPCPRHEAPVEVTERDDINKET